MMGKADDDIASINVTSGVNEQMEGFCTIAVVTGSDRILLGQLDPATMRQQAMQWLEAAEAAEQDAAVLRCVRKIGLPDELAGAIIAELRNSRADGD